MLLSLLPESKLQLPPPPLVRNLPPNVHKLLTDCTSPPLLSRWNLFGLTPFASLFQIITNILMILLSIYKRKYYSQVPLAFLTMRKSKAQPKGRIPSCIFLLFINLFGKDFVQPLALAIFKESGYCQSKVLSSVPRLLFIICIPARSMAFCKMHNCLHPLG